MGWLKKAAQIALQVGSYVAGFGPLISQAVPGASGIVSTVSSDLGMIAGVIGNVEMMGQALKLPGTDKLKAASPLVSQIILSSSLLAHHKIANQDKFKAAVDTITSGVVDLLNSLDDGIVAKQTVDKT